MALIVFVPCLDLLDRVRSTDVTLLPRLFLSPSLSDLRRSQGQHSMWYENRRSNQASLSCLIPYLPINQSTKSIYQSINQSITALTSAIHNNTLYHHRHWEEGKCIVFDDSYEHEVGIGRYTQAPFFHWPTFLSSLFPGLESNGFWTCVVIGWFLASWIRGSREDRHHTNVWTHHE